MRDVFSCTRRSTEVIPCPAKYLVAQIYSCGPEMSQTLANHDASEFPHAFEICRLSKFRRLAYWQLRLLPWFNI